MKLYGRLTSFNVQKVLWLLEELALDFEHVQVGGRFGGLDDADFEKLNPNKKVPVLIDGERVIWESHTILRYLVAEYGQTSLYSSCPYHRSLYERWMDWTHTVFQPAFMAVFWGYYRMPPSKRDMPVIEEKLLECQQYLSTLEKELAGREYLVGSNFSLADLTAGAVIYRLTEQGLEIELPPSVAQWFDRLKQRKGYQKYIMSDFTELRAREDY
ncbi:glutathione S-transferase family protein [Vibrio sonorensis]|uniref:glutathione S-transferase family protein n=1 Tax=Vibrio sonorensis TaxID=1004316 RepID=UPI0008DA121F|nr:glutathione S-transferase family protein [Vibrio sonorensis]